MNFPVKDSENLQGAATTAPSLRRGRFDDLRRKAIATGKILEARQKAAKTPDPVTQPDDYIAAQYGKKKNKSTLSRLFNTVTSPQAATIARNIIVGMGIGMASRFILTGLGYAAPVASIATSVTINVGRLVLQIDKERLLAAQKAGSPEYKLFSRDIFKALKEDWNWATHKDNRKKMASLLTHTAISTASSVVAVFAMPELFHAVKDTSVGHFVAGVAGSVKGLFSGLFPAPPVPKIIAPIKPSLEEFKAHHALPLEKAAPDLHHAAPAPPAEAHTPPPAPKPAMPEHTPAQAPVHAPEPKADLKSMNPVAEPKVEPSAPVTTDAAQVSTPATPVTTDTVQVSTPATPEMPAAVAEAPVVPQDDLTGQIIPKPTIEVEPLPDIPPVAPDQINTDILPPPAPHAPIEVQPLPDISPDTGVTSQGPVNIVPPAYLADQVNVNTDLMPPVAPPASIEVSQLPDISPDHTDLQPPMPDQDFSSVTQTPAPVPPPEPAAYIPEGSNLNVQWHMNAFGQLEGYIKNAPEWLKDGMQVSVPVVTVH